MLPDRFTDRHQDNPGAPDFCDSVCWHLLLGDLAPVREIARQARQRLAPFTGLHMTPIRWLHVTVLLAGRAADLTQADMDEMIAMTLCYSTSQQPAAPVITALGKMLPSCEVTIDKLSLVVQQGPALSWNWRRVGAVRLPG